MLEEYQQERIDFIKNILPYFGGEFILKSGTALSLYCGLNRYSEDLDFDCLTSNMNCINRLKQCKDFNKWNISIKKDTDMVFRFMIDYGSVSHLGKYPLKIEISSRNKSLLNSDRLKYNKFDNVNVYCIEDLIEMKATAFSGRDKIRDFFDLGYLLKEYPHYFKENTLFSIREKIIYSGEDELNLLLKDEILNHKLISKYNINITDGYAQDILNQIETLMIPNSSNKKRDKHRQR